jgi:hypothetical protein
MTVGLSGISDHSRKVYLIPTDQRFSRSTSPGLAVLLQSSFAFFPFPKQGGAQST